MSVGECQAFAEQDDRLWHLIQGYRVSQMIHVVTALGLPELVRENPVSAGALAQRVGAVPDRLLRLLRALTAYGVFSEPAEGVFALADLGRRLLKDAEGSLWRIAMNLMEGEAGWMAWSRLSQCVKSGVTGVWALHGQELFDYLAARPADASLWYGSRPGGEDVEVLSAAGELDRVGCVVDVGAAEGELLVGLLQRHQQMRGVLVDLPHVVDRARAHIEGCGLATRCELVGLDFLRGPIPRGDAVVLREVLHDWADGEAVQILRNCGKALEVGGAVLVVERVVPEACGSSSGDLRAVSSDIHMMIMTGGRERSVNDYRELFHAAGLDLVSVSEETTRRHLSVLKGTPWRPGPGDRS